MVKMRTPRRIADILKRKQEFIDAARDKLNNSVIRLQSKLLDGIVTDIVLELDIKDGVIQDTAKNYQLISQLDGVYKRFEADQAKLLLPQLTTSINKITGLNETYFKLVVADIPERFEKIIEATRNLTDLRFGLKGGKFVRGGLLESVFSEYGGTEVKQIMSKAVSSNMNIKDFVKQMRGFVAGTAEKPGISERKFKQFAYDVYQQYDRSYNVKLALEFGMKYFIYQGGIIVDSRDFCAAHNNKVWSIEETESWATWTPNQGKYPADYKVKSKSPGEVPSYLGYPGYDPLIDFGGYNCRHSEGFIGDELAFRMRPELKK